MFCQQLTVDSEKQGLPDSGFRKPLPTSQKPAAFFIFIFLNPPPSFFIYSLSLFLSSSLCEFRTILLALHNIISSPFALKNDGIFCGFYNVSVFRVFGELLISLMFFSFPETWIEYFEVWFCVWCLILDFSCDLNS